MNEKPAANHRSESGKTRPTSQSLGAAISQSPLLWGGALTGAFYAAIPALPFGQDKLQRYFCGHPLEYALVGLFFVGLAILSRRFINLKHERAALAAGALPDVLWIGDSAENLNALEKRLDDAPPRQQDTVLLRRLRDACGYLRGSHSATGLESHLKYLSETAADRLHDSYSLLLTINWAVPIIGFLGTVIGITLAIANVTGDTSVDNVTSGLAVAFDTTAVSLSLSLVLVFVYDRIKRSEQQVLWAVDDIALQDVLPLFASSLAESDPLQQAQADAAKLLIDRTETLVREQTEFWQESVDGLRERWSETLVDQQQHLTAGLNSGVATTLNDHSAQLRNVRQDFLSAFEQAAERFTNALAADRESREEREASSQQQFEHIWQRVSDDLEAVIRSHDAHTEDVIDGLMERLKIWQAGLERNTQSIESQMERLQALTESLLKLADQEEQLVRVERQLSENLDSVRAAETFDQTLHNLTAAVHLLTARAKPKAA